MSWYSIRLAVDALRDLRAFKAYHRNRILDEVDKQLKYDPTSPARNRKLLVDLLPSWEAQPPIWELRIGEFRVFYDVSEVEKTVYVRAVRRKAGGQTTEDIL
jgi:mRNA-degrading endonuclease RelE of RelBE toxin-antitoxin system